MTKHQHQWELQEVCEDCGERRTISGFRIEYHGKADDEGRCFFTLYWMADYHPGHPDGEYRKAMRGQNFFADPRQYGFDLPPNKAQSIPAWFEHERETDA